VGGQSGRSSPPGCRGSSRAGHRDERRKRKPIRDPETKYKQNAEILVNLVCLFINLCSQGPGTEVTLPEVYESIDSEQYVFLAFKEDGLSSSPTKFQMN
jgi:hypothetical protein